MKKISQVFNLEENSITQELIRTNIPEMNPLPAAETNTPLYKQVDKEELEAAYREVGVIRHSIRTLSNIITSKMPTVVGPNEEFFRDFLRDIGRKGGEHSWNIIYKKLYLYQFIYGDYWVEMVYEDGDLEKPIVDIDFVSPTEMDYARDSDGRVVVDRSGNPIGYTQRNPRYSGQRQRESPDPVPPGVHLDSNQVFFMEERIVHFMPDSVGSGLYGLGLIEPIYKQALYLLSLEKVSANKALELGFPIKVGTVGNSEHEPTQESIEGMGNVLRNASNTGVITTTYYNKIELLQPKNPEVFMEFLRYYVDEIITGIGIPKAFATGIGDSTNRSTLVRQEFMMKTTMKTYLDDSTETFTMGVFQRIAESHGFKEFPALIPPEIVLEELDAFAERILKYSNAEMVTPDLTTEQFIRDREGLPPKTKVNQNDSGE